MSDLTLEALHAAVRYDPDTGVFTRPNGKVVGWTRDVRGYRSGRVYGKSYSLHRLAWFYTHGVWPRRFIDHINGDPSDNRIVNLRDVSDSVNQENRKRAAKLNICGFLGVSKQKDRYVASIKLNGKRVYIGTFRTPETAHEAYLAVKRIHHVGNTL